MNNANKNKEVLEAMITFCNYQERCSSEIQKKLFAFDIDEESKEAIIEDLKEFNYLDDERYTEAFIRGKHSLKKWGKNKIKAALYQKRIPSHLIDSSLAKVLVLEEYTQKLELLFQKKWDLFRNKTDLKTKQKLFRYLYSKGYESALINKVIQEEFNT